MANLVLRTCNSDMTSYGGFKWPTSGYVEAPDWMPTRDCGNGLHGWLHGHGDGEASSYWDSDCNWLVVSIPSGELIDLNGKVKFKCGEVVFCGDRIGAIDYLLANDQIASTAPIVGAMITVGSYKVGYGGHRSVVHSGNYGVSRGEELSTVKSGVGGVSISSASGVSDSGINGYAISGNRGTSTCGDYGTAISGYLGTSTSGFQGTSTSGSRGTAISGNYGTSFVGEDGHAASGEQGTIIIRYWNGTSFVVKVGYIGKDGLLANELYRLDKRSHNFVRV